MLNPCHGRSADGWLVTREAFTGRVLIWAVRKKFPGCSRSYASVDCCAQLEGPGLKNESFGRQLSRKKGETFESATHVREALMPNGRADDAQHRRRMGAPAGAGTDKQFVPVRIHGPVSERDEVYLVDLRASDIGR